jgi:nucleoside phosphorylase
MPFDFGIVCAKDLELTAAELAFGASPGRAANEKGLLVCSIPGAYGELRGVLAPTSKQRELSAAAAAMRLIKDHGVRLVVMTGVAAGVPAPRKPEDHVRLGDVVVADSVVKFDEVKLKDGVPEYRGSAALPDSQTLRAAKMLISHYLASREASWQSVIDAAVARNPAFARPDAGLDDGFRLDGSGRRGKHPTQIDRIPGQPLPRAGAVGSSAALMKDARKRNALAAKHGLSAIEMEAAGLASGAWEEGASYLFIKGICDYGDRDKQDLWQRYAALASAAFARSVLETALEPRSQASTLVANHESIARATGSPSVAAAMPDRVERIEGLQRRIARMTNSEFEQLKLLLDAHGKGFDCEGGPPRCAVALIAWAENVLGLSSLETMLQRMQRTEGVPR